MQHFIRPNIIVIRYTKKGIKMKWVLGFLLLFSNVSCASADVTDFQKAKATSEVKKLEAKILDAKYVGFTKEEFIKDFGKPKKIIIDAYPYSLDVNCYAADCPEGIADELLTYEFLSRDERGKYFYSVYAYIKDGKVVRIR